MKDSSQFSPLFLGALAGACAAVFSLPATFAHGQDAGANHADQPNVVLFLTDDLGWQDVACYDIDQPCPYETPNIDALAAEGVKFWQAYSPAPTCAPSRGAVLAGKHPARLQRTHVVGGAPPIPHQEANWTTIAPWYMRKYCEKMGVPYPDDPNGWNVQGQHNPYYGAMVEMLDYYVGQVVQTLKTTDDPRRPGHKLMENTYIIFTWDNGGICKTLDHGQDQNQVWLQYQEHDNKVVRADLLYTTNGGERYEEWFRAKAVIKADHEADHRVTATLPKGTTHYLFNLVDEHQFLVSLPRMGSMNDYQGGNYSTTALQAKSFTVLK